MDWNNTNTTTGVFLPARWTLVILYTFTPCLIFVTYSVAIKGLVLSLSIYIYKAGTEIVGKGKGRWLRSKPD